MKLEKPKVLLVTEQSLLGECLVNALQQYDVHLVDTIDWQPEYEQTRRDFYHAAVIHVDAQQSLTAEQTKEIVGMLGDTRVIVFGKSKQEVEIVNYLEAGAFDYRITESESVHGFCQAIDDAVSGEYSFGPERIRAIFERLQRLAAEVKRIHEIDTSILTTRELEILKKIEAGMTNSEIAESLFLSLHTVKNHVHNMLTKMNCKNRREAVHLAHTNGWISVR